MKINRCFALAVCIVIGLTQESIQAPRLFAQSGIDLSLLGSGSLTLETATLEKGSRISLETDLQDVAAIIVEDINAGRELVRIGTASIQKELQNRKEGRPESESVTGADSIKGRFEQNIDYDLTGTKALRVTLILASGIEIPLTIESPESFANSRLTRTFDGKVCQTYAHTCFDGHGGSETCSNYCCTDAICYQCFPCHILCGHCPFDPPFGGCKSAPPPPQQTIVVSLDGKQETVALPKSSFVLSKMEPGNKVSYLMDEWAVVAYSTQPGVSTPRGEVLKASSSAFASAISKDLIQVAQNARSSQKLNSANRGGSGKPLLIVEAPVHPHNSRFVPTPRLRLSDPEVPLGISPVQVLIRADFSEEADSVPGVQILYADGSVPQKLAELLRDRMALDRKPTERHRTIVFALVNINDVIEVTNLATVLPKCCCGGIWCV